MSAAEMPTLIAKASVSSIDFMCALTPRPGLGVVLSNTDAARTTA